MNVPLNAVRKLLTAVALTAMLAVPALTQAQTPPPDLGTLLAQLDQVSQSTTLDLAKLRIEKWKGGGDTRQQLQSNADLLSRNLSGTLPGLVAAVRSAPDNLAAQFKLYRNVDALYDVLSSLADTAGSVAPHSDYQSLSTDASNLQTVRHWLADRFEAMAAMKDSELARLRGSGTASSASAKSGKSGAKKIVIDDTAPSRSSSRKKKPASTPQ